MTIAEKTELVLIPILGLLCWLGLATFPERLAIGHLSLAASALLLLQGLVRDLWLLSRMKYNAPSHTQRAIRCMCVESTVGVMGVILGVLLLSIGISVSIPMSQWSWSILLVVILSFGYLIKDFVLEWGPWRLRREKDHMNIVFTWKS